MEKKLVNSDPDKLESFPEGKFTPADIPTCWLFLLDNFLEKIKEISPSATVWLGPRTKDSIPLFCT